MQRTITLLLVTLLAAFGTARAGTTSTLSIGPGAGTSCAEGCGDNPNLLGTGADVDIYQSATGGIAKLLQPQLLILGIPNDTSNLYAKDPIGAVTYYNPYIGGTPTAGTSAFATAGTYGLKGAVIDGFFGDLTSGSQIYSFLDLKGPTSNTNSFKAWAADDLSINGITADDFGIYVFALSGEDLEGLGLVNVMFPGGLPLGTFVVGYGQSYWDWKYCEYSTTLSNAGLTNATVKSTPEPGSLLLLGPGFLLTAMLLRRQAAATREAFQRVRSR